MPLATEVLPIACVEGWSTVQTWTGVRLVDLARLAGVDHAVNVAVESLEKPGQPFRSARLRVEPGWRSQDAGSCSRQRRGHLARPRIPGSHDGPGGAGGALHQIGLRMRFPHVTEEPTPSHQLSPCSWFRRFYGTPGPRRLDDRRLRLHRVPADAYPRGVAPGVAARMVRRGDRAARPGVPSALLGTRPPAHRPFGAESRSVHGWARPDQPRRFGGGLRCAVARVVPAGVAPFGSRVRDRERTSRVGLPAPLAARRRWALCRFGGALSGASSPLAAARRVDRDNRHGHARPRRYDDTRTIGIPPAPGSAAGTHGRAAGGQHHRTR